MDGLKNAIQIPSEAVGSTVVLGCFDGVHIGHRSLFESAAGLSVCLETKVCAVSFDEPPAFKMCAEGGKMLTDTKERTALFKSCGAHSVVFLNFDNVRDVSAEDFVEIFLKETLKAKGVVCGYNFSFGKNRRGNTEMLRRAFGNRLVVCPPVLYEGEPVSSSRIRKYISDGDIESANRMLGRAYALSGQTCRGRGDGTKLGFATANIFPSDAMALPAPGVYAVRVTIEDDERVLNAIADAGYAPTLDASGKYRIESHIFDFDEPLYDRQIKVEFLKRIRAEKKFESAETLALQIQSDVDSAKKFFTSESDIK